MGITLSCNTLFYYYKLFINKRIMDLRLIYVNRIGYNYKGQSLYEFIFTDIDNNELSDVWGDGWEETPAFGTAQPPFGEFIETVISLSLRDYELETIGNNENYSVLDSVQGIIALAYELMDENYAFDERLVFHFGDSISDVEALLTRRKLDYTKEEI